MPKDRPLEGLRVVLACPTYGPVDPICQRDLRLGMMVAGNRGVEWVADASPDKMPWSTGRNKVVQECLLQKQDIDGIMWVDSDIRQAPSDMASLLDSVVTYKERFVTGVYHQRLNEYMPVFYEYDRKRNKFRQATDYMDNMFAQIGGCGFGFVWTELSIFEEVAALPHFVKEEGWFPDHRDSGGFGEDLSFCKYAIDANIQLYLNTAVQVGHMGEPEVIKKAHYIKKKQELEREKKQDETDGK